MSVHTGIVYYYIRIFPAPIHCAIVTEVSENMFNRPVTHVPASDSSGWQGVLYKLELMLDINSIVWQLKKNEKHTFALVSTVDLEGNLMMIFTRK